MTNTKYKLINSKLAFVIASIIVFGVYFLRIINIDQDLPAWGIAYFQPKDEGAYISLAINNYEYGQPVPDYSYDNGFRNSMYIPVQLRFNIIENAIVSLGFSAFGDNYYATRVPIVFLCFVCLFVEFMTLLELNKKYVPNEFNVRFKWISLGLVFITSLHFYFYIASRTVEPSTIRMAAVEFLFLVYLSDHIGHELKFLLMGIISTFGVLLVYLTNAFTFLAVGILLLFILKNNGFKKFFRYLFLFSLGCVVSYVIVHYICIKLYGETPVKTITDIFQTFSDLGGYTTAVNNGGRGLIINIIKGFVKFFSSFIFLYMPGLLFGVVLFSVPCIVLAFDKKDENMILMLAIPFSLLIQTMFTEDYIWRKSIVILPFSVYLIFYGIIKYIELQDLVVSIGLRIFRIKANNNNNNIIYPVYLCLCVLFVTVLTVYHLFLAKNEALLDFGKANKIAILVGGLFPLFILFFLRIRKDGNNKFSVLHSLVIGYAASLILSLILLSYNIWMLPTYNEKEMLKSLSMKYHLDNKYILGDYIIGCTLYNDIKPVTDHFSNYDDQLISNPDLMFHHYSQYKDGMREYLDNTVFSYSFDYSARQILTIPGTFQAFGKSSDWALYKADERRIIIEENRDEYFSQLSISHNEYTESASSDRNRSKCSESNDKFKLLYPDIYYDIKEAIISPIYVNIHGDIRADVYAPIYGNIYGDIYGDLYAPIYGRVYGSIYGDSGDYIKPEQIKSGGLNYENN